MIPRCDVLLFISVSNRVGGIACIFAITISNERASIFPPAFARSSIIGQLQTRQLVSYVMVIILYIYIYRMTLSSIGMLFG